MYIQRLAHFPTGALRKFVIICGQVERNGLVAVGMDGWMDGIIVEFLFTPTFLFFYFLSPFSTPTHISIKATSLGGYINPLVSSTLGVVLLSALVRSVMGFRVALLPVHLAIRCGCYV